MFWIRQMEDTFEHQDRECVLQEGIGIVKVNEDGKIQPARNFFELAYFQSQLMQ